MTIDGDGETAITITSAGTIVVAGINVTDADTGIFVVNSIAILINISVDDTDSFALEGVDSTIAVMGSFDVGTTSACASGVHIMDCEVLAGLSDATTWDIDIDGDGGHGLWLQGSSLSTYPSSSFEVAAMGASSNSAILVDEESSLWFDGDLAVETPNNDSDGIEVVNSSYLWLMSPSVTIEGSNSPGTNGLRVERSASASLYPNNPSGTAEWTIDGYGRSGIVSGACSAVYLAYLTNGTLTITGALFGSETGAEYESAAGIWIPASSVFEETPSAPNAVGVTTIRDFQHAVALESESLCIIKRMQASLPGLSDPNKLQGDNDTSAFLSWDSRLDIETLVQGDGASSMCEGFSKLAVISGQTEAVIGLGSDPNFRYPTGNGVSSSGSYIIVLDGGHLTLRSDDIAYFNSDETAATCVYGSENAYIDLSGMCMCLQGFRNGFVLDDGASCRADLVLVFSDANDTGRSCFASLNHGSSAQFWFRMGMGLTANNGYAVLCEALNGSEADLDLQGTFQKKPTTGGVADSMVVARYGSHVRMTGHISEDPNHPGDPNYFAAANLVVSDPNDENHLEARMDSSILSGDYVEQGSVCWNDLTFNGSSTPMVINGTTVSTGFDPNEACYISE
ncbi:MAG: hypothetical protein JXQ73_16365 [Phycisphaerae bacterium]|nr:hypothetical protein [Phycisphaerae bacterium]